MKYPAIHRDLRLLTHGGVQSAWALNETVHGSFKKKLAEIGRSELRLLQRFVNWPDDPQSIVRFTKKYGPPIELVPKPGVQFTFTIQDFKKVQAQFQKMWRNLKKDAQSPVDLLSLLGGKVRIHRGLTTYIAPSLYAYLYADLVTNSSIQRIRVCKLEDCSHPYFLAGHLKQQFCSDSCAAEGQRTLKREWWQKHGISWRNKSKRENQDGVKQLQQ